MQIITKGRPLILSKNFSNWLKVISAVLIMLTHYSGYATTHPELNRGIFRILAGGIVYLGPVSIFFFLSGYGLMESSKNSGKSYLIQFFRRISKILFPVLLVLIIWLPIYFNWGGDDSPLDFIANLGDGVLWFIKSLTLLYASFFIFRFLNLKYKLWSWIIFLILCIAIYIITDQYIAPFASYTIFMFFLGSFMSQFKDIYCLRIPLSAILALISLGLAAFFKLPMPFFTNLAFIAILVVYAQVFKAQVICPSILAALSYYLYLTHNKFILIALCNNDYTLTIIEFFGGAIICAYLIYQLKSIIDRLINKISCSYHSTVTKKQ